MSEVKRFHKKEAAKILIELRSKTEDERLMDYRRQLLNRDNNMEEMQNSSDFQERLERSCWPWAYSNPALSPYHLNTIPIGYPPWTPNPHLTPFSWFPNSPSYMPDTATNPYNMQAQAFQHGMDYQATLPWPPLPHQQVDAGQGNRRRRTKFTNEQLAILETTFTHGSKFPSPGERMRLENRTGLSKEKVSVWFQNRRAKEKREKNQDGTGSKEELTTTDSELETEDERQLSICDETPEEDSEIDDTRNIDTSSDMEAPHPQGTIAVDSSDLYHSNIASSFASSAQLMTFNEFWHDEKSSIDETPRKLDIDETTSIDEKPGERDIEETPNIDERPSKRGMDETASIDENPGKLNVYEDASIDEKPGDRDIDETPNVDERPSKLDIDETASIDENPGKLNVYEDASIYEKRGEHDIDETPNIDETPSKRDIDETASIDENPGKLNVYEDASIDVKPGERDIDETPNIDERPSKRDIDETASIDENPSKLNVYEFASIDEKPGERNIGETPKIDENPGKRDIDETASMDEKPDVMATHLSSNDVINKRKKDIDIVEDFDSSKGGSDNFMFQNKKLKTAEKDMFNTTAVPSTEHRMFGET